VWLGKFLRSCSAPLVIFADQRSAEFIVNTRANMSYKTTVLVYESIWKLMGELEVKRNRTYRHNYQHVQLNLSRPELFAIWNLKVNLYCWSEITFGLQVNHRTIKTQGSHYKTSRRHEPLQVELLYL
jgi:hypothetical protein